MAVGVYLTKGVSDVFDRMEKLQIKKINKIINDLRGIMSNAPMYVEKISLDSSRMTIETLENIFGKKYTSDDFDKFIKIFKNIDKGIMSRSKRQ